MNYYYDHKGAGWCGQVRTITASEFGGDKSLSEQVFSIGKAVTISFLALSEFDTASLWRELRSEVRLSIMLSSLRRHPCQEIAVVVKRHPVRKWLVRTEALVMSEYIHSQIVLTPWEHNWTDWGHVREQLFPRGGDRLPARKCFSPDKSGWVHYLIIRRVWTGISGWNSSMIPWEHNFPRSDFPGQKMYSTDWGQCPGVFNFWSFQKCFLLVPWEPISSLFKKLLPRVGDRLVQVRTKLFKSEQSQNKVAFGWWGR